MTDQISKKIIRFLFVRKTPISWLGIGIGIGIEIDREEWKRRVIHIDF